MAKQHAHGPARVGNERLDGAIGIEPDAVEALDGECVVGGGGDHGWKDAARAVVETGEFHPGPCRFDVPFRERLLASAPPLAGS
jgi:hypothetical protein